MRVGTLVALALSSTFVGCSGSQPVIGSSIGASPDDAASNEETPPSPSSSASASAAAAGGSPGVSAKSDAAAKPEVPEADPEPEPDPASVKALVDTSGEAGSDNALHLKLEVLPRPAGELWLVGVINRGTEAVKTRFDLRRLTLTLLPPPPEAKTKASAAWKPKPKPVICKLPEGFGGLPESDAPLELEPGEGLVQTFDPRLYCISPRGESLLSTGQHVSVKLGYEPKPPRVVWKQGRSQQLPSLQQAPFVAEPAAVESVVLDAEHDPRVKQLTAREFLVTAEMTDAEAEEDPTLPLQLRLLHGSDAATELGATVALDVRARKRTQVYFRRELVSFTVHGPDGIRSCDPQPDERAPDRQAYVTLGPGQTLAATSLLAELCPKYTFGRPGLYVVSARFDANRDGAEFGLSAFTGRLDSRKQALIRIKTGELKPLPPPEPLRVKVGQ
jgi:hypothetical protein